MNKLILGDCLEKLKYLENDSVDAIVSDPPYELGFMGKKWDNSGIAYNVDLWKECLRVLKPGGHLLAFGGTRTYHRIAVAIEDAGFEVRDMLEWIYASGFPKSLNVGKAVDKLQGNEREVVGIDENFLKRNPNKLHYEDSINNGFKDGIEASMRTKGYSEWEGFGTALKPAHEPIIMARKPLSEKTIVENVLKHGTGAIDIDGCRIPIKENDDVIAKNPHTASKGTENYDHNCYGKYNPTEPTNYKDIAKNSGRFPANIICTDDALNDGVIQKSNGHFPKNNKNGNSIFNTNNLEQEEQKFSDSGSKSRYFDIDVWAEKYGLLQFPKASKKERNEGLDELEEKIMNTTETQSRTWNDRCFTCKKKFVGSDDTICHCPPELKITDKTIYKQKNNHPTVKPVHLMSWLVKLVSRENDIVLDPFMGSGTTGVACNKLNRSFIGIEMDEEYIKIAEARINNN